MEDDSQCGSGATADATSPMDSRRRTPKRVSHDPSTLRSDNASPLLRIEATTVATEDRPAATQGISPLLMTDYDTSPTTTATTDRSHAARSEEHKYELQSLMRISYAVFCVKKKQI